MSFFLTIIGNSIVIYAFWTAPSIAPPSRVFFINLAVSDFLVGLVVLSLSAVFRARIHNLSEKKTLKKKTLLADKIYSVTTELKINVVLTECFRNF